MKTIKNLRVFFFTLTFFFLFISSVNAVIELDNCTTISSGGAYELNTSIIDSSNSTCILITTNHVIFNGNGFIIDGIDTESSSGIYFNGTSANITVINTIFSDWNSGISNKWDFNLNDCNFSNNIFYSNNYGVNITRYTRTSLYNNTFFDNTIGIIHTHPLVDTGAIFNNTIINSSLYSIYFENSYNVSFYNNFLNGTDYYISTGVVNNWSLYDIVNGSNIIGGNVIGGNYWGKSNGSGFSDLCIENNLIPGTCVSSYEISSNNIDFFPLTYPTINESSYDILLEDILQEDYDDCEDCRHLTLYYYEERNDLNSLDSVQNCLEDWPGWTFEQGIDSYFGNYIRTDTYGCGAQRYIEEECDTNYMYITEDYVIWRMDLNSSWEFVTFIDGIYSRENLNRQVGIIERSACGLELNYMGENNSIAIGWSDTGYLTGAYQNWEFGGEHEIGTFNYQANNYQWNGFRTYHTSGTTEYYINDALIWYNNVTYICNDEIEWSETYSSTVDSYLSVGNNTLRLVDNACYDFHNVFIMQIENNYRDNLIIYPDVNDSNYWTNAYNLGRVVYLYSLPYGMSTGFNIMIYDPIWNEDYYNNEEIYSHISVYNEFVDLINVEYFANDNTTPFRNYTNIYCPFCSTNDFFLINITRDGFNISGNNQKLTVVAYNSTGNITKSVYFNILPFTNYPPTVTISNPISTDYIETNVTLKFLATDLDGVITNALIWLDGSIYKEIENINNYYYSYEEDFILDDNPHSFLIEIWDNDFGWNFNSVDFTTGLIINFDILSPLTFTGAQTYNINDNLTMTYEMTKHPYLLNYMEIYVNDIILKNISRQLYYSFAHNIDSNFTSGMNTLKFKCYYGESNNILEKTVNVFINPFLQIQVLNGLTYEPIDNVKIDFYEYHITPSLYRFRIVNIESIGDYLETGYTEPNGIATFYFEPDIYLFKMSKIGYENKEIPINEDTFGILYQTILEPITTNISIDITFNTQNSSNNIINSLVELTDLVTPSNTYTFYSNSTETITAGTYSVIITPIEPNIGLYKIYYTNLDISKNLTYTVILENIGTSNKVFIQTFKSIDSSIISNVMINIRENDIFIQSIYKSTLEPLEIYLEDGNYSFGGSKDDFRLLEIINSEISSDTNINLRFRFIDISEYITISLGVFQLDNKLINGTVNYSLFDVNLSIFVESSFFSGGTTSILIIKDVYYKLILSSNGFQDKEFFILEDIDTYYKIIMFKIGEEPDIPIGADENILNTGIRLFFINAYAFLVLNTGGGFVLGIILMLFTLWTLNAGTQKTPEKTQLSYLLIEALAFTILGLFPPYFGIIIIIVVALFLSKTIYPSMEGN